MYVALGAAVELHRGIHGSLSASPPSGVRYIGLEHRHRFLLPRAAGPVPDPFTQPSLLELVRYDVPRPGLGFVGVHSSRLPVDGGAPFVVDTDDLVLTVLHGRPLVRGGQALLAPDHPLVRRRALLMLGKYLDDACAGLLFRTRRALDAALGLALDLAGASLHDRLAERSEVVRPAVAPGPPPWPAGAKPGRSPHVVFVGEGWDDKGGPEAAEVMAQLVRRHGGSVRLTWVGPCPAPWSERLGRASIHELLARQELLQLLTDADVVLAPSRYESFGMVLLEALAHGAVPVTSSGPGMEHVTEMMRPGIDALLVPTDLSQSERVSQFLAHVEALLARPDLLTVMQRSGWKMASTGPLSLSRRDDALLRRYSAMREHAGSTAAVAEPPPDASWLELTPEQLSKGYHGHRAAGRRVRVVQTRGAETAARTA